MNNIVLIGFMGSGKTTVGQLLAQTLGYTFADTDQLIEAGESMTVADIFAQNGEGYFRQLETLIMEEVSGTMDHTVLSVGGGLPMTGSNHKYLKKCGKVVYLKVSEQTVINRLKGNSDRPLLSGDDATEMIYKLLALRAPTYQSLADITIAADHMTVEEIVQEIIRLQ
ncbi:MAG: shikimate kinase [bacterium]|nr:shikimate kinase [bacterium]